MNSTGKTLTDFKVGQGVTYVPNHASDLSHPARADCVRREVKNELSILRLNKYNMCLSTLQKIKKGSYISKNEKPKIPSGDTAALPVASK